MLMGVSGLHGRRARLQRSLPAEGPISNYQNIGRPLFFFCGATSGFEMWFATGPRRLWCSGGKARLEFRFNEIYTGCCFAGVEHHLPRHRCARLRPAHHADVQRNTVPHLWLTMLKDFQCHVSFYWVVSGPRVCVLP